MASEVTGLYILGSESATGKLAVALGVHELMGRRFGRLGVFRPVVAADGPDPVLALLRSRGGADGPEEASIGVTFDDVHADPERAIADIVARYRTLAGDCDGVLVVGSDFTELGATGEFAFNASVAANLGIPVMCVVSGVNRSEEEVVIALDLALTSLQEAACVVDAFVANRVDPAVLGALADAIADRDPPVYLLPEVPLLAAPTIADLMAACSGELISGEASALGLEATSIIVASMTLPNMLDRLTEGGVVIAGGDRAAVVLGVLMAHASATMPALSGLMLTGGLHPDHQIMRLLDGLDTTLPIVLTEHDTYPAAHLAGTTVGQITPKTERKINAALRLFDEHVDRDQLLDRIATARPSAVTPLMFEYELFDRARADRRHIVLAEGTEDRVLRAADTLLRRGVAKLTLLGDPATVTARASNLHLDISAADLVDPADEELLDRFAKEYARLRAHKGVTLDGARDVVADVSYFGTMMVVLGLADGMVSGAVHTTAAHVPPVLRADQDRGPASPGVERLPHVPARPGARLRRLRVTPDPTAEQLADIAIPRRAHRSQFGIEPRVAMLSYSTGRSGTGEDVEKVRAATELVRNAGPACWSTARSSTTPPSIAAWPRPKMPGFRCGRSGDRLIFPDLNTGNNTYKAVQRTAGAIAIGPVLQGLNKPVNDLSRGALVEDIVNTVAITAIQAQHTNGANPFDPAHPAGRRRVGFQTRCFCSRSSSGPSSRSSRSSKSPRRSACCWPCSRWRRRRCSARRCCASRAVPRSSA